MSRPFESEIAALHKLVEAFQQLQDISPDSGLQFSLRGVIRRAEEQCANNINSFWNRCVRARNLPAMQALQASSMAPSLQVDNRFLLMQNGCYVENVGMICAVSMNTLPDELRYFLVAVVSVSPLVKRTMVRGHIHRRLPSGEFTEEPMHIRLSVLESVIVFNRTKAANYPASFFSNLAFEFFAVEVATAQSAGWSPERHCYFGERIGKTIELILLWMLDKMPLELVFQLVRTVCADDIRSQEDERPRVYLVDRLLDRRDKSLFEARVAQMTERTHTLRRRESE